MNIEVKAVGFSISDEEREIIDKKIERFQKSAEHVNDLIFTFTKEGAGIKAEVVINFKGGPRGHLDELDHDLRTALDKLVDKAQVKITKEKEKSTDRRL
ncbi:MAG: ribosome-associated translation inhibitor RaiA [Spirochaetaceae bacterium]|jgi:ribosomal subunit interface protein|nr:ribosome-associated translation inhibitor RaiA [Spirochaetaceae bacterium]